MPRNCNYSGNDNNGGAAQNYSPVEAAGVGTSGFGHGDLGWPVDGVMVPSFWMAVSNVVKANSLECIAGSHKDATRFWNYTPNSMQMIQPPDRPHFIDYDKRRDDPSLTFLSWDMEPGDALLIHPWCYHYSCGNPTPNWRIAVPTRWFGDDIRWNPRPESDCGTAARAE